MLIKASIDLPSLQPPAFPKPTTDQPWEEWEAESLMRGDGKKNKRAANIMVVALFVATVVCSVCVKDYQIYWLLSGHELDFCVLAGSGERPAVIPQFENFLDFICIKSCFRLWLELYRCQKADRPAGRCVVCYGFLAK